MDPHCFMHDRNSFLTVPEARRKLKIGVLADFRSGEGCFMAERHLFSCGDFTRVRDENGL